MSELILLSGGLDSATALAQSAANGAAALAVSVDYGQRHNREVRHAERLADHYGVPWMVLDLRAWGGLLAGSALTDAAVAVPHGHYAAPSMAATIVPNRNATLLCAAAGVAQARGIRTVVTAVHAGDHPVYPDCRPEFIAAIDQAIRLGTDNAVGVLAPFQDVSKTDIARLAGALGVPVHLTWSCYEGGELHCGRCGTCTERIEALRDAGVPDPTGYVAAA